MSVDIKQFGPFSYRLLGTLLPVLWPALISAQDTPVRKPFPGLVPDPLQSLHISNYLIGIVVVFVTLAVASWLLRRYQPRIGHGQIRVQACLSLGGKERLMLVEVQERRLLIGVCPAGINLLQDLNADVRNDQSQQDEITPIEAPVHRAAGSWLQQTLKSVTGS